MCTRPATDSTATGSGGATMAPSAMAAGTPIPGIISHAAPATAAVLMTTSATASMISVRHRTRNTAHELRWAVANSSGGRKMGRISSGSISRSGKPGMKVRATARRSIRTGYGSRSLSPSPTATTVASSSPTIRAS